MIQPTKIQLYLVPDQRFVEAEIVSLTRESAEEGIHRGWWNDDCLAPEINPAPIDRAWNWNGISIVHQGRVLASEKVAVVGAGTVQGAMMISTDPVPSVLDPGEGGLFIELLFTAPRNRPNLRKDKAEFLKGVGLRLLMWGVALSKKKGYLGRILLDSSPDFVQWYLRRGLQVLPVQPIVYEDVTYTPMELAAPAAQKLLELSD